MGASQAAPAFLLFMTYLVKEGRNDRVFRGLGSKQTIAFAKLCMREGKVGSRCDVRSFRYRPFRCNKNARKRCLPKEDHIIFTLTTGSTGYIRETHTCGLGKGKSDQAVTGRTKDREWVSVKLGACDSLSFHH